VFLVEIHDKFTADHSIELPSGIWEEPHGHEWQLRIFLIRQELDQHNMVVDFIEAQRLLRTILDPLEDSNLNEISEIGPSPTAELVAGYIAERFNELLSPFDVMVKSLALGEAENCWAWYVKNGVNVANISS
jgi:6-pyruvoyltetrahydropterin/6-carboxytetrahydropterin synthase